MSPEITQHARVRSQQRALSPLLLELLVRFGSSEKIVGGTCKVFFDKAARRRLHSYAGPLAQMLDQHLDLYAVLANDKVVTVGHRLERIKRH